MIRDIHGKVHAFVVRNNTLLHQPTGLRVEINAQTSDFDAALHAAMENLRQKIKERNDAQRR
jgi:hypothetical protein